MAGKPRVPYIDLVNAYREAGSARVVAEKFCVSDQTVYHALQREGVSAFEPRQTRRTVTDEQIIEAYKRLGSGNKVAKELRTNAVYDVLRKHGVITDGHEKYRERVRKIGPAEKVKVVEDYASGLSASAIAAAMRCSTEIVLRALRDSGATIRFSGGHMTEEEKEEANRLYLGGLSFRQVAKAMGRHENTILHLMNDEFPEIVRSGQVGPGGPHWRGGRTTQNGYSHVWISPDDPMACMAQASGYVAEHRLVMARKIGRPLRDTETVHHIDGEKQNNDPANLELRQGKHGKHVVMCCLDCGSRNVGHVGLGVANGKDH